MNKITLILLVMLFFGACKPPAYLPRPNEFSQHVKGLVMEVDLYGGSSVLGEIIEVNDSAILILPIVVESKEIQEQLTRSVVSIPKGKIENAGILIATTSDNPEIISTAAGIINLAPVGHGWFMVFTVPINLVSTITLGVTAARGAYKVGYPYGISWEDLPKFARFPQGIPEHITLDKIW